MLDICIVSYSTAARDLDRLLAEIELHTDTPKEVHTLVNFGNKLSTSAARNNLANDGARNYIAFLEPDIHLEKGWASAIISELESVQYAGCIIPRMIAAEVKIQYPDAELKDRFAFNAVVMRRSTWKALYGFDERYRFFGADADFRKRLGVVEGRDTVIAKNVAMVHERGVVMLKGAMAGGLDLNNDRAHRREIANGVNDGTLKYWHELDGTQRSSVRQNPKYQIQ